MILQFQLRSESSYSRGSLWSRVINYRPPCIYDTQRVKNSNVLRCARPFLHRKCSCNEQRQGGNVWSEAATRWRRRIELGLWELGRAIGRIWLSWRQLVGGSRTTASHRNAWCGLIDVSSFAQTCDRVFCRIGWRAPYSYDGVQKSITVVILFWKCLNFRKNFFSSFKFSIPLT